MGQDTKGIFYNTSSPGQPVVEDPLLFGEVSLGMGLHHPGLQGKGLIPHNEVRYRLVISWQWLIRWQSQGVAVQGLLQNGVIEDGSIRG